MKNDKKRKQSDRKAFIGPSSAPPTITRFGCNVQLRAWNFFRPSVEAGGMTPGEARRRIVHRHSVRMRRRNSQRQDRLKGRTRRSGGAARHLGLLLLTERSY